VPCIAAEVESSIWPFGHHHSAASKNHHRRPPCEERFETGLVPVFSALLCMFEKLSNISALATAAGAAGGRALVYVGRP
jgi:hypothetical protein